MRCYTILWAQRSSRQYLKGQGGTTIADELHLFWSTPENKAQCSVSLNGNSRICEWCVISVLYFIDLLYYTTKLLGGLIQKNKLLIRLPDCQSDIFQVSDRLHIRPENYWKFKMAHAEGRFAKLSPQTQNNSNPGGDLIMHSRNLMHPTNRMVFYSLCTE